MIYKFRMLLEDNEDFVRDFEVKSGNTFEDFHDLIKKNVKLNKDELASFFICDSQWQKLEEITLIDMASESDDDEEETEDVVPTTMDKIFIKEKVIDPHQRIIYEYDFLNTKSFYLELIRIEKETAGVKYPRCVNKKGEIDSTTFKERILDVDENALLEDFNDLLNGNDSGFEIEDYSDSDF